MVVMVLFDCHNHVYVVVVVDIFNVDAVAGAGDVENV